MNAERPMVIIMRGLPGSGKDHKIKSIISDFIADGKQWATDVVVCSADDYFLTWGPDDKPIYTFNPMELAEAHAACLKKFVMALSEKRPLVIVNNTHSRKWEYEAYMRIAALNDYQVEIEFAVEQAHESKFITVGDIRTFAKRNVHGVPLATIAAMAARWED